MTNDNDDFNPDDLDTELDEDFMNSYKPLDLKVVKEKLPSFTSEKLCEMIVCDRYFGCFRDIAVMCMEELARRRGEGSDFLFEEQIERKLASLPKLSTNFALPDLQEIITQVVKNNKRARR
jgi:hypothetical protein